MPGYFINPNTETVQISTDLDYFLKLAKFSEAPVDLAFFKVFQDTYRDGVWPEFMDVEPETSGCILFDGTITRLYKHWQEFTQKHPNQYKAEASENMQDLMKALTDDNCACESREKVLDELKSFLKIRIGAEEKKRIAQKIEKITAGSTDISFNCSVQH